MTVNSFQDGRQAHVPAFHSKKHQWTLSPLSIVIPGPMINIVFSFLPLSLSLFRCLFIFLTENSSSSSSLLYVNRARQNNNSCADDLATDLLANQMNLPSPSNLFEYSEVTTFSVLFSSTCRLNLSLTACPGSYVTDRLYVYIENPIWRIKKLWRIGAGTKMNAARQFASIWQLCSSIPNFFDIHLQTRKHAGIKTWKLIVKCVSSNCGTKMPARSTSSSLDFER